jgi:hypothetical protein
MVDLFKIWSTSTLSLNIFRQHFRGVERNSLTFEEV